MNVINLGIFLELPVAHKFSRIGLAQLVAAFDLVRGGKILASPDSPGKVLYKVGGISFLMRAPDSH